MFRGMIPSGADIEVTFQSDYSNAGAALLMLGAAFYEGGSRADSALVAPAGSATVKLGKVHDGRLEVLLDVKSDDETGLLVVAVNGETLSSEAVRGDIRWVFAVES